MAITDDALVESAETFKVTLSNPKFATLSDPEGVATITDNDTSPSTTLIVNPKFDNGMANWTAEVGTGFATNNSSCGANVAYLEDGFGSANVEQCIVVSSHATDWTLSADMRVLLADNSADVSAKFYASNNCTGSAKHSQEVATTLATMQNQSKQFSYDTNTNGITSIKVTMSANYTGQNFQGQSEACFDNLSLVGGGILQPRYKVFVPIMIR